MASIHSPKYLRKLANRAKLHEKLAKQREQKQKARDKSIVTGTTGFAFAKPTVRKPTKSEQRLLDLGIVPKSLWTKLTITKSDTQESFP